MAAFIDWAWSGTGGNADVLSNSWNYACTTSADAITVAINDVRKKGRNGRGCLVVFFLVINLRFLFFRGYE
ncbi:MAG: hypothetical protein OHK0038_17070 [Flammeovirgaceae bacterium]